MITIVNIAELSTPFDFPSGITDNLDLYSYGSAQLTGNLFLYSVSNEIINSNTDLYSVGAKLEVSGVNLYAAGQNKYIVGGLNLYTFSDTSTPNSSLNLFAYTSSAGFPTGSVDLFARVPEGGTIDCIAFGPSYSAEEAMYMYSFGANGVSGGLNLSIPNSINSNTGSLTLYCCGF